MVYPSIKLINVIPFKKDVEYLKSEIGLINETELIISATLGPNNKELYVNVSK